MNTNYKRIEDVPTADICKRLRELSDMVTKACEAVGREFDMRVPAELDHDIPLVLSSAAYRLAQSEKQIQELKVDLAAWRDKYPAPE